ncbi:MAG TPA: hypothetical protein VF338_02955, partial [Leptolinea sp.]
MNTNLELKTGNWLLLVGSHSTRITVLKIISRLADVGPVRVVDGGFMYNPFMIQLGMHSGMKLEDRIEMYHAYRTREMLISLESMPSGPAPFVIMDFLSTFTKLMEGFEVRKNKLSLCLAQINRLVQGSSGLVTVHFDSVLSNADRELLELVTNACNDTYHLEMGAAAPI